jgi:hypothetical protein
VADNRNNPLIPKYSNIAVNISNGILLVMATDNDDTTCGCAMLGLPTAVVVGAVAAIGYLFLTTKPTKHVGSMYVLLQAALS